MLPADLCSSTGSSPQYFTTQIHVRYLCSAFSTDANPLFRVFSVSAVCHLGDIDCSLKLTSCMQNIKPVFVRQHWQAVRCQPNPESWPDEYQHDCLQGVQPYHAPVRPHLDASITSGQNFTESHLRFPTALALPALRPRSSILGYTTANRSSTSRVAA